MAPPPAAAAGDPTDPEPLEVRCVGCRETLEVDRGLTEFICPDCATPQSLPPELMPPPPPRRKALPLPRGAADVHGARLPCGAGGALLSVPVGLPRCACPLCGADLAVDTERLRHYLLSSAATADAVPVVPLGASSLATPILQAREVCTMPKGMRIPVSLNASGEPIGKQAATLSAFLGALARDGILAPLAYLNWRCVPENNKDVMCHIVKLKFDIAPVGESWIVKKLGSKWRSCKALLKKQHFDTHETEEEHLADRNPRVLEEQWRFLVAYWSTETAQAASARNKASQAKVTRHHTSGTKGFARVIEEEKQKRPNKDAPSVEDLFILTHAPKDGRPMTKVAADAIARFREQYQNQTEGTGSVFGLESFRNGRRGKGAWKASLKEAMEAKRKAEDEAAASCLLGKKVRKGCSRIKPA